jgi:hypothetical protein
MCCPRRALLVPPPPCAANHRDAHGNQVHPIQPAAPAAPARSARAKTAKRPTPKRKASKPVEVASKQAQLIALLKSPEGGMLEQMTSLTGWQPHSVRGAISGALRKRLGFTVVCAGIAGSRVYRIVAPA